MTVRGWVVAGVLLTGAAASAAEDTLKLEVIFPGLPGKNNVRWWEFDWKYSDFVPLQDGAPVRLYFYEDERRVAEVAKPFIAAAYAQLAEDFNYLPSKTIPFLLYNSHFEFLSTRAFLIGEGTLGVTSTEDLTMALPYWGEHQRFLHVMEHEMAHQFTIQKVNDRAGPGCTPLIGMPLWFIEGVAELYSREGLTPEVRGVMADRLIDEDPEPLPHFFESATFSYERIYLIGHAQVRFLEEVYGEGTVQRILDLAPTLCATQNFFTPVVGPGAGAADVFAELVAEVTGDPPEEIDRQWYLWARETIDEALTGRQQSVRFIDDLGAGDLDSLSTSPDGRTVVYRLLDRDSGVARLYLRDVEDPGSRKLITQDQRIGLLSLHPTSRRVSAISEDLLVYIGRVDDTDVVFVRPYERIETEEGVRFELGPITQHDVSKFEKLIEAGHPAISPTGQVAFTALNREGGFVDIYRIDDPLDPDAEIVRVTSDAYAEESLAWAPDGALYFASDQTPDARYEIFRLEGERAVPVTSFPGDQTDTRQLEITEAGLVFVADPTGLDQAWRLEDGEATLLTNVPTWLQYPALASGGEFLLGVVLVDGDNKLVMIPREEWVGETVAMRPEEWLPEGEAIGGAGFPAWDIPRLEIEEVRDYNPLANLGLQQIVGAITGGPYLFGSAVLADRFRTNLIGIDVSYFNDFDRTNGALTYLNQSGRTTWGAALFVDSGLQLENVTDTFADTFIFQRLGAQALASYPLGRYMRIEGFLSPQAIRGTEFSDPGSLFAQQLNLTSAAVQGGAAFALDTTKLARFGPYSGATFTFGGSATVPFLSGASPFYSLTTDLQGYQPLLMGYERLFLYGRLGAGASLGGAFREDFFVPATQNLRAYRAGSLQTLGEGYYLGQFELHFPLAPEFGGVALQGVVGADAGAVFYDYEQAWESRVAAGVAGAQLALGPVALGLYFARPFGIGGTVDQAPDEWLTHFEIVTPFGGFFGF